MDDETKEQQGWLANHPEEQQTVHFHVGEETIVTPLFRELSPEDEAGFRQHARENYSVGTPIDNVYHPVWRDEAKKMNKEYGFDVGDS